MKTVLDLRNDLLEVYEGLKSGKLGINEVKQSANIAGKIMATAKDQMEYNKMVQSKNRIKFLDC